RSSVNVNNKGSNRSANFFHAGFLVLFILLFASELKKIPLPALASILVYTGYKLASPENLKKVLQVGSEQLIIFLMTLLITISTSLITGILVGIIITFVLHVIINKNILLFVKNILKPNVLMFTEDGKYYVSVKNFSSFLNFTKLKSKLNQIPETDEAIVDFSLCDFVDHSVMENMSNYTEAFARKGGDFEVIGLDDSKSGSEHPFALRKILPKQMIPKKGVLTKRQKNIQKISEEMHYSYDAFSAIEMEELPQFGYFKTRKIDKVSNVLSNDDCTIFDVQFSEGEMIAKQVIRATMLHIHTQKEVPNFTLDKEGIFEYLYHFAGFKDINLEKHPDFSKRFYLLGKNEAKIRTFFTDELILFLESNKQYHIEASKVGLLIFSNERLASVKELKALAYFGASLRKIIEKC
ncbi:SulP family inorganic anion transporter, partial [Polaribacter sp.]|nr:SulP family inorganic anion transporter [Polaribacter sp.]